MCSFLEIVHSGMLLILMMLNINLLSLIVIMTYIYLTTKSGKNQYVIKVYSIHKFL